MNVIGIDELKAKLDRGDDFRLVMTMGEWAFASQHIPGSINIGTPEEAAEKLRRKDEIVVYCSDPTCVASQTAYRLLSEGGYRNVRRFAGGLTAWAEAGYPFEGKDP